MKPSRELDALIAEKVMGWYWADVETADHQTIRCLINDEWKEGEVWGQSSIPHYSTKIADAWQVVEKLKAEKDDFIIEWHSENDGDWIAQFYDIRYGAAADSAPHAICLAALKALGVTV